MLMDREQSLLLVIDVQTRLAPVIHEGQRIVENCVWLARLAARLGVPVVVTEHFPDKLGPTVEPLKVATAGARYVTKEYFSALADGCLGHTAFEACRQVVVCGAEAHVCVQQTSLDLRAGGREVFLVADAVGSRDPLNRELACERMRAHGIDIVSREMVAYEWLRRGGTELFSEINREFLR